MARVTEGKGISAATLNYIAQAEAMAYTLQGGLSIILLPPCILDDIC
eukprot:gene6834-30808_t